MGKLISSINITPDGYCGHSDVIADEELHEFATGLLKKADTVLFGRVTYQLLESYWPMAAKNTSLPKPMYEFAQLIDKAEKVVASKTLKTANWQRTSIIDLLNTDTVQELKAKKEILIFGSPGIVSLLTKLGLIDEYYFSVQPILAGKGKRFFDTFNLDKRCELTLTDRRIFKSGAAALCYRSIK